MKMLLEHLRQRGEPEQTLHYLDLEDMTLLHLLEDGHRELSGWLAAQGLICPAKCMSLSMKFSIFQTRPIC